MRCVMANISCPVVFGIFYFFLCNNISWLIWLDLRSENEDFNVSLQTTCYKK